MASGGTEAAEEAPALAPAPVGFGPAASDVLGSPPCGATDVRADTVVTPLTGGLLAGLLTRGR